MAGNRTSKLHPDGINAYYSWDAAGRMTQVEPASGGGTVSLTYNADGQRVVKEHADGSATGFLYDYKRLLHETDEVGGSISNTYLSSCDQEFGDLIAEDEQPYVHQYDAMANTNALLDVGGPGDVKGACGRCP